MGELIIISEKGVPHTAVRVQIGNAAPRWYGFRPKTRFKAVGKGLVDTSNRDEYINTAVHFHLPDEILVQAVANTISTYRNATYILFVRDCVRFVIDFSREANIPIHRRCFSPRCLVHTLSQFEL